MEAYTLKQFESVADLAKTVVASNEPAVVYDGEDECLVVMRPSVFERILFDSDLLNSAPRTQLHL